MVTIDTARHIKVPRRKTFKTSGLMLHRLYLRPCYGRSGYLSSVFSTLGDNYRTQAVRYLTIVLCVRGLKHSVGMFARRSVCGASRVDL